MLNEWKYNNIFSVEEWKIKKEDIIKKAREYVKQKDIWNPEYNYEIKLSKGSHHQNNYSLDIVANIDKWTYTIGNINFINGKISDITYKDNIQDEHIENEDNIKELANKYIFK